MEIERLKRTVAELGAIHCGIAPAVEATGFSRLVQWIELGYGAGMDYIERRLPAYQHPSGVMEGVKSIVVMAFPYPVIAGKGATRAESPDAIVSQGSSTDPQGRGRLARYLWDGDDYHDRLHEILRRAAKEMVQVVPGCRVRGVVDTAPILEREFARLAGLGWQGKNTLLINKWSGSYFFLCCLLTDAELPYDAPHESDHCGTCTRCIDACPTQAFPQPGLLDAGRCISYLTIENQGVVPYSLRSGMGDWLFGCDICQEVCPWNTKRDNHVFEEPRYEEVTSEDANDDSNSESSSESNSESSDALSDASGEWRWLELDSLFELDDMQFRSRFRKTPLWRAKRRGILRNAAIVLGNQRQPQSLAALALGLGDTEPLVRGACAWAIGQIGNDAAKLLLKHQLASEVDPMVVEELQRAWEICLRGLDV